MKGSSLRVGASLLVVVMVMVFACTLASCSKNTYGTLTIGDISLNVGQSKEIDAVFSKPEFTGDITYTFEGSAIAIADGTVTGITPDTTTVVSAKTEHHSTTFTVTVGAGSYGTLRINNMAIEEGATVPITPGFSVDAYKNLPVTYTYAGNDITIANGMVTGNTAGTITTVTATTQYHSTTFTVRVKSFTYGDLTVTAPAIFANYPAKPLTIEFSKAEHAEEITYTVPEEYKEKILIENDTIRAVGALPQYIDTWAGIEPVTITATTAHHATSFEVYAARYDGGTAQGTSLNIEAKLTARANDYTARLGEQKGGVIFAGDSFFDAFDFWTSFYSTYAGKSAACLGIGGTTVTDWEIVAERLIFPYAPKAVVLHCGTNDVYDDKQDAVATQTALKRLFEQVHAALPSAKIYYFGIEPRVNGASNAVLKIVNDNIRSWINDRAWIAYLDSPALCYDGDTVKSDFFRDGIHPKLENYSHYVNLLQAAGLEL